MPLFSPKGEKEKSGFLLLAFKNNGISLVQPNDFTFGILQSLKADLVLRSDPIVNTILSLSLRFVLTKKLIELDRRFYPNKQFIANT
jgi:hypothetical protein